MKVTYPVVIAATGDDKDTCLVEIPDIHGYTQGHGLTDALDMARDYIFGYCCGKDPDTLPAPSDPRGIDLSECLFADGLPSSIETVEVDI